MATLININAQGDNLDVGVSEDNNEVIPNNIQEHLVGISSREEEGMGSASPHKQQKTLISQRPIHNNASVDTNVSTPISPNNTIKTANTADVSASSTTNTATSSTTISTTSRKSTTSTISAISTSATTDSSKLLNTTGRSTTRRPFSPLPRHLANIIQHLWPIKIIKEGYKIQFAQTQSPWYLTRMTITREKQDEINIAISKFITAGQIGHTGRIHRHTYTSSNKTFLSVRNRRRHNLPMQIAKFRFKCSTKNFFQKTAVCRRTMEKARNPFGVLLLRHLSAIKRRKIFGTYNRNGNKSSRVLRIHYNQEKEHADSVTGPGISRFSIRHSHHEDQGTGIEGQEVDTTNQASSFVTTKILPVDCRTPWEDYSHVAGGGRSIITHPPLAEELGDQSESTELQLGKPVSLVCTSNGRANV
ncbi:hypothetical protein, partial, partial [Parasitella parasitica]